MFEGFLNLVSVGPCSVLENAQKAYARMIITIRI